MTDTVDQARRCVECDERTTLEVDVDNRTDPVRAPCMACEDHTVHVAEGTVRFW
jgi:hypothetical protein